MSEVIRVQPDGFGGLFRGLLKKPKSEAPKVIEYLGKMAVRTTSLGPKMAAGSSPARATKSDHTPSMSRYLTVLENAGLVTSERKGQRVLYRLNPGSLVNTLTGFAFEICPVAGPLKRESRALAKRRRATQ